jgi:serine/threonine-protein kinase
VVPDGERQAAVDRATPKACPSCGARFTADALFCSLDGAPLTKAPGAIAAAAATDPYLGREVLGHIEIRQLVGIGAMGRVYRAFQRGIDRDVAVKVLHPELSANPALVARFHREAKVASRLAHPHVVHVLVVGQLPDGAMYIVMEYLDGMSLQSALAAAGGAMPLPRALHIALQLCEAAGEAHAQGIVHRDLKPDNVMLVLRADDPDYVKVLDFGIARLDWDAPSSATAAGLIFGTARYISPEGAQGERVAPAGDVYSIATMTYQMLAGRTPFDAEQTVALLVQQIHEVPPALQSVERSSYVPDPVAAVVMQNLSKRADERAPDARAFGRALLEAAVRSGLSAQDILARPALLTSGRPAHASVVQMPSMQRTKQLTLEPDVAARIDAASAAARLPEAARPTRSTAYETPAPMQVGDRGRTPVRTEVADPAVVAPTVETTKWSPPADFEARVSRLPPSDFEARGSRLPPSDFEARGSRLPPSDVDATLDDQLAPLASPAGESVSRAGRLKIVVACLLAGALGMTAIAWQARRLGGLRVPPLAPPAQADGPQTAGVNPAVDDVAPSDSAFVAMPHLDVASQGSTVPPLATTPVPAAAPAAPVAVASSLAEATRVVLEASSSRPGLGQPVDFDARVIGASGARKVEAARFQISGPGLAPGTELPSPDDGSGTFRTTFTFLQPGRFDVRFGARANGVAVGASRAVTVGDAVAQPAAPISTPAEPAATSPPSAKWL